MEGKSFGENSLPLPPRHLAEKFFGIMRNFAQTMFYGNFLFGGDAERRISRLFDISSGTNKTKQKQTKKQSESLIWRNNILNAEGKLEK